jgi:hypothetical protein
VPECLPEWVESTVMGTLVSAEIENVVGPVSSSTIHHPPHDADKVVKPLPDLICELVIIR